MIIINKYFEFKCRLKTRLKARTTKEKGVTTVGRGEDTQIEMDKATNRLDIREKITKEGDHTVGKMKVTTSLKAMEQHIRETTTRALKMAITKKTKSTIPRRKKDLLKTTMQKRKKKRQKLKMKSS